jgi:hypothetical protein
MREVKVYNSNPDYPAQLRPASNTKHAKYELEKEALRFSFVDGVISDVCPSDDDSTWSINVKRGFLSAFQNSMDSLGQDQTVMEASLLK